MALTFNSVGRLSRSSTPITTAPLTMALWFNLTSSGLGFSLLLNIVQASNANANNFYMYTSSSKLVCQGAGGAATGATTLLASTWYHGAGIISSLASRIVYVNGTNDGSNSTSGSISGLDTTEIGGDPVNGNTCLGQLAFPAIWNVALSASDLAALAKGISPKKIRPDALVTYCRMIGASPEPDLMGTAMPISGSAPTLGTNPPIYAP